jgi:hypothetical protein
MKVNGKRRIALIVIGALTAVVLLATAGSAFSGKHAFRPSGVSMIGDDNQWWTSSPTWDPIPTSFTTIKVTPKTVAYLKGSFSAESVCLSERDGFCSIRIMFDRGNGPEPFEPFDPVLDDFAFDSPEQLEPYREKAESHAVERSSREVKEGEYKVWVEARVEAPVQKFGLDDWHFTVEAMCFGGSACTP